MSAEEFLKALRPIAEAMGASVVPTRSARAGDVPAIWHDQVVAYVRAAELHGALGRLVAGTEREAGAELASMDRAQKQAAVRSLDQQGAFLLRGAVEDVARQMGVSRVTLYSYLNAIRPEVDGG